MTTIDPLDRWREFGEKPDYAGLLSFAGVPYTEDAGGLEGADVAIVGAPMDDLVSDRPGARFAPRAIRAASCPPGPHLQAKIDWSQVLRVVDYGDAPCIPANPAASHEAIERTVGAVHAAGALPVLLGGDHSVSEPAIRAAAARHGAIGLIHFDAHTDTGDVVFGATASHGTPMRHLVEQGHVDPARYVQIGLRGYWPGDEVFGWQQEQGITAIFMHEVSDRGVDRVVADALSVIGDGPAYASIDIDVLDPAFVGPGGTGTPEPGGLTTADLLGACRATAQGANLVGADIVEVIPQAVGSADLAALTADRVVREVLTGLAMKRTR